MKCFSFNRRLAKVNAEKQYMRLLKTMFAVFLFDMMVMQSNTTSSSWLRYTRMQDIAGNLNSVWAL